MITMSLYEYEFAVPPDLERGLRNAGIYAEDTESTTIIKEPLLDIPHDIRQEFVEEPPVLMPSLGDIKNPEANLEAPFHVFHELSDYPDLKTDARRQILQDIIAMKPEMREEQLPDIRQTYDLVMRIETFSDNDPPDTETMLLARMAAYRIADVPFEQAATIYTTFMEDYQINLDVIDTSDSSLVEDIDRWLDIMKITQPVQYEHAQACVDFIRPAMSGRDVIERMVGLTLLQIAHYQEMQALETSSETFDTDAVDPLGDLRYQAAKTGDEGLDVAIYSSDELRKYSLMGELLADPTMRYDPKTNDIIPQTNEECFEQKIEDRQRMQMRFVEQATIAREERVKQFDIRSETIIMTRRMGYAPTVTSLEAAYVVRHAVHHALGVPFTKKSTQVNFLYNNDISMTDAEWAEWAKKILDDLQGNEEFTTKILPGVDYIMPDTDQRALGRLIAAVSYEQVKYYQHVMACRKGQIALDAAHWLLTERPDAYPATEAREEPSLAVIKRGLEATGFTDEDLERLPLREIMWFPSRAYHPKWNRMKRQKDSQLQDKELTKSQQFALEILKIRKVSDMEVESADLFANDSANMARKLISHEPDIRAFKLTNRARHAAALICELKNPYVDAAAIYAIHTDVKIMKNGRPPLASVADNAQIRLYQHNSTAKTIDACALLLGDNDEDTEILRTALCLAIDQIQTWRLQQQAKSE